MSQLVQKNTRIPPDAGHLCNVCRHRSSANAEVMVAVEAGSISLLRYRCQHINTQPTVKAVTQCNDYERCAH